MLSFVDALFGCAHRNYTFPRTATIQGTDLNTYIVCLDCGKEFPYDWQQMKQVPPPKAKGRAVLSSRW
jgi:hypothetical protein